MFNTQKRYHDRNNLTAALTKESLRKKLVLFFILIAAVPLIITTFVSSYLSQTALKEDVYENNHRAAAGLAREIDQMLDAKIKLLLIMSRNPAIVSMDPEQQLPVLRNIANQFPDMTSLIVADAKGVQTVRTEGNLAKIDDRLYFKELMNGANFVISDLLVAKGTGKMSVIIGVPIPNVQGTVNGVLLGVVDINYLSNYIAQTKIGETGYAFLVDNAGRVIAHPDTKLVQEMTDASQLAPVQAAIKGMSGYIDYEWQGVKKLAGYSFVPMARWGLVVQQNLDEAMAASTKVKYTGFFLTIVAIIAASLFGFLAAKQISKPLQQLVAVTSQVAGGDLTGQAKVETKDEIGQLGNSFNEMIVNLKTLVAQVLANAEQVAASAQELSATSTEAERAISQIASTANEFAQGAQRQTEEVGRTVTIMRNLSSAAENVAQKAMKASALSEEMAAEAHTGSTAAQNAIVKINEIKSVTANTSNAVISLGDKSKQIGQIIDVITDIAGQTNLLALNAAIEAARAGEAGRGFAVVAEEVRKLAEQSEGAAKQITQIIAEIQAQTDEAIQAMKAGTTRVDEGVDVVETAGGILSSILAKVQSSVKMIEEIAELAKLQVASTSQAVDSVTQIAIIAEQSSANAQHTAAATEETTASMEQVAGAAQSLAEIAGELQTAIGKFKV